MLNDDNVDDDVVVVDDDDDDDNDIGIDCEDWEVKKNLDH